MISYQGIADGRPTSYFFRLGRRGPEVAKPVSRKAERKRAFSTVCHRTPGRRACRLTSNSPQVSTAPAHPSAPCGSFPLMEVRPDSAGKAMPTSANVAAYGRAAKDGATSQGLKKLETDGASKPLTDGGVDKIWKRKTSGRRFRSERNSTLQTGSARFCSAP